MAISTLLLFKDASNGEETRRSGRVKEDRSPTATAQNYSGNICISNNISQAVTLVAAVPVASNSSSSTSSSNRSSSTSSSNRSSCARSNRATSTRNTSSIRSSTAASALETVALTTVAKAPTVSHKAEWPFQTLRTGTQGPQHAPTQRHSDQAKANSAK